MLLLCLAGSPNIQHAPRLAITSTIPRCSIVVPLSVKHSIETGEHVCPLTSKGERLAAWAFSSDLVILMFSLFAKSRSKTLTSAPESTSAEKVNPLSLHFNRGDVDFWRFSHAKVDVDNLAIVAVRARLGGSKWETLTLLQLLLVEEDLAVSGATKDEFVSNMSET